MQPDRTNYSARWEHRDDFVEDLYIETPDNLKLHAWYIANKESKTRKGLVVQLHGNAQNLSSHFQSVFWLVEKGFDVIAFDYRGYGMSEGQSDIFMGPSDIAVAIDYAAKKAKKEKIPLIVYGQSLGGSLLLKTLKDNPTRWPIHLTIVESSFHSYQGIAREKLSEAWLTWPFQWLSYLLISSKLDPGGQDLAKISHIPNLLLYSEADPIVPIHHGQKIFSELRSKKEFWTYPSGHVAYYALAGDKGKKRLIEFIESIQPQ